MTRIYPSCSYDTALPQPWVNEMQASGFDPREQVVWAYPNVFGCPYPLSPRAAHKILSRAPHPTFQIELWKECGLPPTIFDTESKSALEKITKLLDKTRAIS
jgi:hypothetical protein